MKEYLISLKHGFEMLARLIAKGSPKTKIKPYHKIKDFYKTQKNQDVITRGKVNFL